MKPPEKLYRFHAANLREVAAAFVHVDRALRHAISTDNRPNWPPFTKLLCLLLGVWAECRLNKLLYEPRGFSDQDRAAISAADTQIARWHAAVDLGFRGQYKLPQAKLETALQATPRARYRMIRELLELDLAPIIEVRNKLAHGQWTYPLNNPGDDVLHDKKRAIDSENLLTLRFKKSLLESLSGVVHDLVVSRPTFERDFDKHFNLVEQARRNLHTRDFYSYITHMQEKFQEGRKPARAKVSSARLTPPPISETQAS